MSLNPFKRQPMANGRKDLTNNGNTPRQVQVVERVKLPEPHEHNREFYGGHANYERPAAYEPHHDEIDNHEMKRLDALAEAIKKLPLDNIAEMTLKLTFGDMMLFAEGLWNEANVPEITKENLPQVLHNWAKAKANGDKDE